MKYVLDTNICAFYFRGNQAIRNKMYEIGFENLFISEITVLELLYGAANSTQIDKKLNEVNNFVARLQTLPIHPALLLFATEKARLNKLGTPLENFDLLIGVSAVQHNMTMVTNNTRHFERVQHIILEDWFIK
jgi:tRNA(fMet)-specific endonuclease VapC